MSQFNPEAFMGSTTTEASSTVYLPHPEGEFPARLTEVKPNVTDKGKAYLRITWVTDDEGVRKTLGQAEPKVWQTIWLDINEAGALEVGPGKNVQLGKLREALNQNQAGMPWSPPMLVGQVGKIRVKHSIDKRDNVTIQAEVAAVTKL